MGYCDASDLEERYGSRQLAKYADFDGDNAADSASIQEAIDDASGLIDSYLSVSYSVPIDPTPDALRERATTLAYYFLQLRRNAVTEDYRQEKKSIEQWLAKVASGDVSIGVTPKPDSAPSSGGVYMGSDPRFFGRDKYL